MAHVTLPKAALTTIKIFAVYNKNICGALKLIKVSNGYFLALVPQLETAAECGFGELFEKH